MKLAKYIIVRDRNDEEHAIVFPDVPGFSHKDVSRIHRASDVRLVSAGFCDVTTGEVSSQTSESLRNDFPPRNKDTAIIRADFGITV